MRTKLENPRYMMATVAIHKLGDISRTLNDICFVEEEDEDNFYGSWLTGFGFFGVRFPKETTRPLNEDEIRYFDGMALTIGGQAFAHLKFKEG